MICVRYKDARHIATTLSLRTKNFGFARAIACAECTEFLYFEHGLKHDTFFKDEIMSVYKLVGRLERDNIPFILLTDTDCEIHHEEEFSSVINVNCIAKERLEDCFPKDKVVAQKRKARIFHDLFKDFHDTFNDSLRKNFYMFNQQASLEDLTTKDVIFLVVSAADGEIINGNGYIGQFYDDNKIWMYGEDYDYDPKTVDDPKPEEMVLPTVHETLEEFSYLYEKLKSCVRVEKMAIYTEAELTAIMGRYPQLFADLVKKKYSYYHPDISAFDQQFVEPDDDIHQTLEEVTASTGDDGVIEEYFDITETDDVPQGTTLCYSCEDYILDNQTRKVCIEGKMREICDDCCTAYPGANVYGF